MTSNSCSTRDRAAALLLGAALLAAAGACGGKGRVLVEGAWARPASAGGTGAVYLVIRNDSGASDRLAGAASAICDTVELHRTEVVDDRMTMRHLAAGVPLGAGERVEFVPGGHHVMLLGLRQPLEIGTRFTLSLDFEHAGAIAVEVEVRHR